MFFLLFLAWIGCGLGAVILSEKGTPSDKITLNQAMLMLILVWLGPISLFVVADTEGDKIVIWKRKK